ncbi:Hsp20 family protein [Loktanella sp. DJP18]|uniref:Hsp20 family protein n=1 Tax=Loktanella sp. DJP18 TaxID=3409788 RepID=UPI003BB55E41
MQARHNLPTFGLNPAAMLSAFERAIDQADSGSYPPFNILKSGEHTFSVEIALAGFSDEQITISVERRELIVEAKPAAEDETRSYLHKGIAQRAFRRVFRLGEHMQVADASMADGMLVISLVREIPEADQPRRVNITRN